METQVVPWAGKTAATTRWSWTEQKPRKEVVSRRSESKRGELPGWLSIEDLLTL